MKIALLISGRAARYEVCLLPMLENTKHEIDIFMSINDENTDCEYYKEMRNTLSKWLKKCVISKYEIPQSFIDVFKPKVHWICLQKINENWLPMNVLSMYANDKIAFNYATTYADENNFEYDCYMKYRTDMILDNVFEEIPIGDNVLYTADPVCYFQTHGIHKVTDITDDNWIWGTRGMMQKWSGVYDYILEMNIKYNGEYYIAYEDSITDYIIDKEIPYTTFHYKYGLDRNRRIFDKQWDNAGTDACLDIRKHNIAGALPTIDIKTVTDTKYIHTSIQ